MSEQRNIFIDNIDFSEALRYLGYGNSTPDEKTKEILYNCADQLKSVMEGKYTYKVFDLVDGQVPGINFTLEGKSIANLLKNCEKVIFMCATLSAGVDGLIRKMQIRGMADAMFTDSLASAVIEQVCNKRIYLQSDQSDLPGGNEYQSDPLLPFYFFLFRCHVEYLRLVNV